MLKEDCFQLGHISRKHGTAGEVIAVFDTDFPENYTNLESFFLDFQGELIPFFVMEIAQNSKGHFILKLEDVDFEEAGKLIGRELFLPLKILPPLSGKNFYFHEVVGFQMLDSEAGLIGICKDVLDNGPQPIFKILDGETEILVPAVDEFIEKIDRKNGEIHLNLPDGLLEIYRDGA